MGQTLTHGIYLPDEGERNCYNGLAGNWQLLDGAVGTIAEHTSQIAGKAPLVHTHTKADITDFPVYGNTAGTICEGNDSRLSDARTPVAHTHVTADVTDLLSGNHTWTGDNTFSKAVGFTKVNATTLYAQNLRVELGDSGLSGDSYNQISFWDKNGDNLSYLRQTYNTDGTNVLNIFVRNKFLNGVPNTAGTVDYAYFGLILNADKSTEGILKASFRPYDNNAHDLGSSSYQWNNLYAKNYYYNGVAWGLDKANTWSAVNQYSREIQLAGDRNAFIAPMWEGTGSGIAFLVSDVSKAICFGVYTDDTNNNNRKIVDGTKGRMIIRVGEKNSETYLAVEPRASNAALGNSSNKWKTLNGIDPGALSLPDTLGTSGTENVNYFNVIGYLTNTGTLATIPSTATYDGWLYINAKDGSDSYIIIDDSPASFGSSVFGNNGLGSSSVGLLCLMCPIRKGHAYNVRIKSAGIVSARIYPAQGNV